MKFFLALFLVAATTVNFNLHAQTNAPDLNSQLHALFNKVEAKINDGKTNEADYKDEIAQFDSLLAQQKGAKTDDAAQIAFMKAQLYLEIFNEPDKGKALIEKIKADYPDTKIGKRMDEVLASPVFSDEQSVSTNAVNVIAQSILTKVLANKTEADCVADMAQFDALAARQGTNSTAASEILASKAKLYIDLFRDPISAKEIFLQIKTKYPATSIGQRADEIISDITPAIEKEKIRNALVPGTNCPDFHEKDLNGNPISLGALKGKITLLDFWATWCAPCLAELPNVIATYKKYHAQGFEIIGVTLDDNSTELNRFLKERSDMNWPQYFDGQGFDSKLAAEYGVDAIPFTILIGPDGKIIATNLRGDALDEAVEKALTKK